MLKNYALASNGSTATASSTFDSPEYSPSAVINGSRNTNGQSPNSAWAGEGATFPSWLEIDLGQPRSIFMIDVTAQPDGFWNTTDPSFTDTAILVRNTAFKVQYWNGSLWVDIANVKGNNKVRKKFELEPLTTSKIRVYITAAGDNFARLVEVEAWGEDDISPAFTAPQVVPINEDFSIRNLTTGQGTITYSIDPGDDSTPTTDPTDVFAYATEGEYSFSLTATSDSGSGTAIQTIRAIYDSKTFPLEFSGFSAGSEFVTTVCTSPISGREQRVRHRHRARDRFNAAFAVKTLEDIRTLKHFFLTCGGKFGTFLLKDPLDHSFERTLAAESGDGVRTAFQIRKKYEDSLGNVYFKNIFRPKRGTIKVWLDGEPQESSNYSVGYDSTGKVTFTKSVPDANAVIEFAGEFYKNCRFDMDELDVELLTYWVTEQEQGLGQPTEIPMVEVFT